MVWKRSQKSPTRKPAVPVRFRPHLDSLEDRLLLTLTTFYVDDTQSFLTLSGSFAGAPLQQQGAGSLTAAYTGAFAADLDYSAGPTGITFINGGNDVVGENSGNWQPMADGSSGSAPAVYGGQISLLGTALAAVRNVNVGADSGGNELALSDTGDGATFAFPNSQTLTINTGNAAYSHPILGHGTFDISGQSAANQADSQGNTSTLYDPNGDGSAITLTVYIDIQISGTVSGFQYVLNIDGVMVANGSLGTSPAAHGGHGKSDATLSTSLVTGTQSSSQALLPNPLGNLEHSNSSNLQQVNLTNAQSQSPVGTTDSQVIHPASVTPLDAVFIEMSPVENLTI